MFSTCRGRASFENDAASLCFDLRASSSQIPDPTESEDWPSSDEPTTRRVATPPVAVPQRTVCLQLSISHLPPSLIQALPPRMIRAGSPAPWSGSAPLPPPRSVPSPPSSLARRVLGELPLVSETIVHPLVVWCTTPTIPKRRPSFAAKGRVRIVIGRRDGTDADRIHSTPSQSAPSPYTYRAPTQCDISQ